VTTAAGTSNSVVFTINSAPVLTLSSLSPNSANAGGSTFTLTLNGTGFLQTSQVQWNGTALTTNYVSAAQLTASVGANLIMSAGTANVVVSNPGGAVSSTAQFTITGIAITGLSPNSASAGGPQFTLLISGTGFATASTVLWNNSQLSSCAVLNPTQIACVIPSALVVNSGSAKINVLNPGGNTSNTFGFNIGGLTISSLSPPAATAGSPSFPLAVNGSGFTAGSVVQWNGAALITTYVSATQVVGLVTAAQVSSAGTASVTVVNPGGAQANSITLPVSATALTISTGTIPSGTVGSAFSQPITASGGTPPYGNWRIASGALPSGLSLDATAGLISGTATGTAGASSFSLIVADSTGAVSPPKSLSITVNPPSGLTIVTPAVLPTTTVGGQFTQAFSAAGGTPPYQNWALDTSGTCSASYTCTLPPGTSLSALGGVLNTILSGTPTAAGSYQFGIRVTDSVNNSATKQFTVVVTQPGAITISAAGVVSSADYLGGSVAPGELITMFGSGMGPSTLAGLQLDGNGNVAKSLAGVQVIFDGTPAPLIYVSSTQLSAAVPYEVAGQTSTKIQVQYQGRSSNIISAPVASAAPGIYTLNASGGGGGAVINSDGTINSPTNPAKAGSYISVYATGEGQTNPPGVDGVLDGFPAPTPAQIVTATVGGANAPVLYAGGVPSLVAGVLQLNLQLPAGVSGNAVPLLINIGGATSQTGVTVAISSGTANSSGPPTIASLSTTTVLPLTPLYIPTSGVNPSAVLTITMSDAAGFKISESPIRILADGTVVAAVPLYVSPVTGKIGAGAVSLSLTQNGITSSSVPINIQDLPALSSYNVQPGQVSRVLLALNGMVLARRLNEYQAVQLSASSAIDTSKAQTLLKSLLSAATRAHTDVDQILATPKASIFAGFNTSAKPISFDASSLDLMDRVGAVTLLQVYGWLTTPSTTASRSAAYAEHSHAADTGTKIIDLASLLLKLNSADAAGTIAAFSTDAAKLAALGTGSTPLEQLDAAAAAMGGVASIAGLIPQNAALGAVSSAVSVGVTLAHEYIDIFQWAKGLATNDFTLYNKAVQDISDNEINFMAANAGLAALALDEGGTAIDVQKAAGLVLSTTSSLLSAAGDIKDLWGAQLTANFSIFNNSVTIDTDTASVAINNPAFTANLSQSDGYVNLSGTPSVNQAGINMILGGGTLNALTDTSGNYSLVVPENVSNVNYSNASGSVVDSIGGETIGSFSVNLSEPTAGTQIPQVSASYPAPSSGRGYSSSYCQSTKAIWDESIATDIFEMGVYADDDFAGFEEDWAKALQDDLATEAGLLTTNGCWAQIDATGNSSSQWP
jgi:uncharacterized protein (TIGR03437 family)